MRVERDVNVIALMFVTLDLTFESEALRCIEMVLASLNFNAKIIITQSDIITKSKT